VKARYYVPNPSYRYSRILYPITARLMALRDPVLIPYTLILVNVLAVTGTVLTLAVFVSARGISPWWGLVYGLYPGTVQAVRSDLTRTPGFRLRRGRYPRPELQSAP